MLEGFTQAKLIEKMKKVLGKLPDSRKGKNTHQEMLDDGIFGVFYPNTIVFRTSKVYKDSAESMLGMVNIPSDNQIRKMLAFLCQTILHLEYRRYQIIRQELCTRKMFFHDVNTLPCF